MTTTLHIEHAITDLPTWQSAFARFAEARERAGVVAHRVAQPVEDEHYVLVDLDFEQAAQARAFLEFLQANVWASPEASPALAGEVRTRLLEPVQTG